MDYSLSCYSIEKPQGRKNLCTMVIVINSKFGHFATVLGLDFMFITSEY
jgi:hypothetical protein